MTIADIAKGLVVLCREGKFAESGEKYWAEDVVSVESGGENSISHGKAAARAKGEWWSGAHEIHATTADGPYINGDQFAVRFTMDITNKQNGQRMNMDEIGLYTVKDGKITEERFFYAS